MSRTGVERTRNMDECKWVPSCSRASFHVRVNVDSADFLSISPPSVILQSVWVDAFRAEALDVSRGTDKHATLASAVFSSFQGLRVVR
jgi:hypothetical protein